MKRKNTRIKLNFEDSFPNELMLSIFSFLWEQHRRSLEIVCPWFCKLLREGFITSNMFSFELYMMYTHNTNLKFYPFYYTSETNIEKFFKSVMKLTNHTAFTTISFRSNVLIHINLIIGVLKYFPNLKNLKILNSGIIFDEEKGTNILDTVDKIIDQNKDLFTKLKTFYIRIPRNINKYFLDKLQFKINKREQGKHSPIFFYDHGIICCLCKNTKGIITCSLCNLVFCYSCSKMVMNKKEDKSCYISSRNMCYGCSSTFASCSLCYGIIKKRPPYKCINEYCKNLFYIPKSRNKTCGKCGSDEPGIVCNSCKKFLCGAKCDKCKDPICKKCYSKFGKSRNFRVGCPICVQKVSEIH